MLIDEKYLPQKIADVLRESGEYAAAEELRLRVGQPVAVYACGGEHALSYVPTKSDIENTVLALTERSLAAYSEELAHGYITISGGVRVGIGGRTVVSGGKVKVMRDFTSLNIRFPREIKGIAAKVMPHINVGSRMGATLIVSAPQNGKTTLLRDVIRAVSVGEGTESARCTVIDERMELWANGAFDLGPRTDVLTDCPRHIGFNMALRALSPEIIATDEIGGRCELEAIEEAANCGVRLLATAHADSIKQLKMRPFFEELLASGVIERMVFLSQSMGRGTVERITSAGGEIIMGEPFLL